MDGYGRKKKDEAVVGQHKGVTKGYLLDPHKIQYLCNDDIINLDVGEP